MPAEQPAPTASRPATGFAALAKRISGWTANLLATAIVLVAGLAIGRQVIGWWREAEQPAPTFAEKAPPGLPDELRFSTARGPLEIAHATGDRFAALAKLRHSCQTLTHTNPTRQREIDGAEPGPGETQFLDRLANERPVEQTEELDLYEPRGELAMVVATSRSPRRIVAWGFALPTGESQWSCYTFSLGR